MARKKAQVTLFIILGVLIFMIILLLFLFRAPPDTEEDLEIPFDKNAIDNFITNCVKDTGEEGLTILGKQGGYMNPQGFVESPDFKIAYLYNNGANFVPAKHEIETDLSRYIDQNMISCLSNFAAFEKQGWTVSYEQPETVVQINQRDVTITQTFLVSVEREAVITFSQFTHTVPIRLSNILNITNEIITFHQKEPEWTDLTALSKHDVDITIFPYKQKLMYSIKDPQSSIRSRSYMFNFALSFP